MRGVMLSSLMSLFGSCFRLSDQQYACNSGGDVATASGVVGPDAFGRQDGLLWYNDTGRHAGGMFSIIVVQANFLLEDMSQVKSGPLSFLESDGRPHDTFVGVYDGHSGPETSCYINEHIFNHLKTGDITREEEKETGLPCLKAVERQAHHAQMWAEEEPEIVQSSLPDHVFELYINVDTFYLHDNVAPEYVAAVTRFKEDDAALAKVDVTEDPDHYFDIANLATTRRL